MTEPAIIQTILQGGSFGLVVIFAVYLGRYLIPKTIAVFEDLQKSNGTAVAALAAKFDATLDREMGRADRAMDRQQTALGQMVGELRTLADQVGRLAERIERLESGTKEHKALQMERRWHDDPKYTGPERRQDDKGGP